MNREIIIKPRLVGMRFDKHAIPMDILKDLTVFEPFIIEVAKWLFLKEHSGRKRVPRGFTKGISLKLTKIEEGSAIPNIALECEQRQLIQPYLDYFERAPKEIINAIDAANRDGNEVLQYLPASLLSYFDSIGRSLHDDERIEFQVENNTDEYIRFDKRIRRKLIELSSSADSFTDEVIVRGYVPEVDQDKMTFELQIISGPKVKAPLEPQYLETVLEATRGYRQKAKVILKGIARFNRYERIEKIESIEIITILDPLDIGARLDELRQLKRGWFDGKGEAFDPNALAWLEEMMTLYYPDELPPPYIYPTPEGNLLLEWEDESFDITLEIDLSTKKGWLHILDLSMEEDEDKNFDLSDQKGWEALVKKLNDYLAEENNE